MKPLLSIVVPAYNVENYIERCLNSILNQIYDNLEIVVIDDGSTDGTARILDRYEREYGDIIKVIHVSNGGVTNARLLGIKESSGDWVGFVDSDDEIEPDMYERLIGNALKYKADISHCGYKTVVDDVPKFYFYNTGKIVEQDHTKGIYDLISGEFVEPGLWNKIFRRALFSDILDKNLIDKNIKINEDLLMNFYLFSGCEKSIYEDICPYNYMVRSTSATRNGFNSHKIWDPIEVRKQIMDSVPAQLHKLATKKYLESCLSSYMTLCCVRDSKTERLKIKKLLYSRKNEWKLFGRNSKIKLYLSFYMPHLYQKIYRFYELHIQKKRYI